MTRRPRCNRPHDAAFTLAEALAVVVICAIVLPVAMRAITLTVSLAGVSSKRALATQLAESKLHELVATGAWQHGTLEGDFTTLPSDATLSGGSVGGAITAGAGGASDDTSTFRWSAELTDWTDATLRELTVTVTWSHRGREHSTSLTTLVSEDQP